MTISRRRRQRALLVLVGLGFGALLIVAYLIWREIFSLVLALGGLAAGLSIFWEVRQSKRIAQAEFIRELNDGFTSLDGINELWRKLLLDEPIVPTDRHHVSAYLTFFETVQLLLNRGVVDLQLVDDLFRNRFFRAIGSPAIQQMALIKDADSFDNIYRLALSWRDHLRSRGIRLPAGYYDYGSARLAAQGFAVERLDSTALDQVVALQEEVFEALATREDWLRRNSVEMLAECLSEHVVIGVRKGDRLVGLGILYFPGVGSENLKRYTTDDASKWEGTANLKLVLVSPRARRAGLARAVTELLEREATASGAVELLCTVHPRNAPSQKLFAELGYRRIGSATTTYGRRDVLARDVPRPAQPWLT